jgi:predicted kinase
VLIVFGGLPGTGKTAIAQELARRLGAVYLRIDSIEQAIRGSMAIARPLDDLGYRVAYAVAEDNLRAGRTVIADAVNPLALTRDAWVDVARRAQACAVEDEIQCSDAEEHRRRVESRITDISGLKTPTWEEVLSREYQPWEREHIVIDTAGRSVQESVGELRKALPRPAPRPVR